MQQTKGKRSSESGFRPHVWGSFFMSALVALINACAARFRPHVWGSFFIAIKVAKMPELAKLFSSPCLGIFFYHH